MKVNTLHLDGLKTPFLGASCGNEAFAQCDIAGKLRPNERGNANEACFFDGFGATVLSLGVVWRFGYGLWALPFLSDLRQRF